MRVGCVYLLLTLPVWAGNAKQRTGYNEPQIISLWIPTVEQVQECEKIYNAAHAESPKLPVQPTEEQSETAPDRQQTSSSPEKRQILKEQHTRPDQEIVQNTHKTVKSEEPTTHETTTTTKATAAAAIPAVQERDHGPSENDDAETSSLDTEIHQNQDDPSKIPHDSTRSSSEKDGYRAGPEIAKFSESFWKKWSDLTDSWPRLKLPPANPGLWDTRDYATVVGSLGSSILTLAGLISAIKRQAKKKEGNSTTQDKTVPSDAASESDSSAERRHTPTSSDDQDSTNDSPPSAPERDSIHHAPGPGDPSRTPSNQQHSVWNVPTKTATPTDASVPRESLHREENSASTRSNHHSVRKTAVAEEGDSSYVLIDKDRVDRDVEAHNPSHERRTDSDKEKQSKIAAQDSDSSEKQDPKSRERRALISNEERESYRSNLGNIDPSPQEAGSTTSQPFERGAVKLTTSSYRTSHEASRHSDDASDGTREEPRTAVTSGNSNAENWTDVSASQAGVSSANRSTDKSPIAPDQGDVAGTRGGDRSSHKSYITNENYSTPIQDESGLSRSSPSTIESDRLSIGKRSMTSNDERTTHTMQRATDSTTDTESGYQSLGRRSINGSPSSNFDLALASLDSVLASEIRATLSDDSSPWDVQQGEWSSIPRSRGELGSRTTSRSSSNRRSSTAAWNRKRWSSPTSGRSSAVRSPHSPDDCAICIANARRQANAARGENTEQSTSTTTGQEGRSGTLIDTPTFVASRESQQQRRRLQQQQQEGGGGEGEEEEAEGDERSTSQSRTTFTSTASPPEKKRLSFRQTLTQVFSPSEASASVLQRTGSSKSSRLTNPSKMDRVKSKFGSHEDL